jgi:hypothetical protein
VQLDKERMTSESRTPFVVLRRVAVPLFVELPGWVKWQTKKYLRLIFRMSIFWFLIKILSKIVSLTLTDKI